MNYEPDYVVYAERADLEPKPLRPGEASPQPTEDLAVRAADRQDRLERERETFWTLLRSFGGLCLSVLLLAGCSTGPPRMSAWECDQWQEIAQRADAELVQANLDQDWPTAESKRVIGQQAWNRFHDNCL